MLQPVPCNLQLTAVPLKYGEGYVIIPWWVVANHATRDFERVYAGGHFLTPYTTRQEVWDAAIKQATGDSGYPQCYSSYELPEILDLARELVNSFDWWRV